MYTFWEVLSHRFPVKQPFQSISTGHHCSAKYHLRKWSVTDAFVSPDDYFLPDALCRDSYSQRTGHENTHTHLPRFSLQKWRTQISGTRCQPDHLSCGTRLRLHRQCERNHHLRTKTESVHHHQTEQYLEQIAEKNGGELPSSAHAVHAQLEPQFQENWQPESQTLNLQNNSIRYSAACVPSDDPSIHEAYMLYADWMARLNFVLHPQSMYPDARLRLNESLRKRKMYPTEVRLFQNANDKSHLRAEHRISRSLDSTDRMMLTDWESKLSSGKLKEVTFREYQQAILITTR
jgi:hypothetical protein